MSIIVYGPQGCGKTLAAAVLKRAFHLEATWDDGNYVDLVKRPLYSEQPQRDTQSKRLPTINPGSLYSWVRQHAADFKSARILFITCEPPPQDLRDARRIVPFEDALQLAVNMGIRTYLGDWPRAQSITAITARTLLEAIGIVPQLQTKPLFNTVNRVMSELGWMRVRLRAPGEPVTWAYRPSLAKEAAHV
jgi:hypothetical protein